MNEADDAAEWVRIMANRYNWGGDLDVLITEAEALGQDGRESVQRMFEHLYFEGELNYRLKDYGKPDVGESGSFR
jgi:hypothetical protein